MLHSVPQSVAEVTIQGRCFVQLLTVPDWMKKNVAGKKANPKNTECVKAQNLVEVNGSLDHGHRYLLEESPLLSSQVKWLVLDVLIMSVYYEMSNHACLSRQRSSIPNNGTIIFF